MDEENFGMQFSTDSDYVGGSWIGGEFYYESEKKKRKLSKNDTIYGIWNEGEEEREQSRSHGKANFSRPMNFISKGMVTQDESKEEKQSSDEEENLSGSDEDENTINPFNLLPTNFGKPPPKTKKGETSSQNQSLSREKDRELGEQYGIGAKLLKGMGWKGGGLGVAERKGRDAPLDVYMRKKNQGLQEGERPKTKEERRKEREEKEKGGKKGKGKAAVQWKKREKNIPPPKIVYKTAKELLNEEEKKEEKQHIIYDMTGKEERVTSASQAFRGGDAVDLYFDPSNAPLEMPELPHNVRELVQVAELEIFEIDSKLRNQHQERKAIERQFLQLKERSELEEKELSRLQELSNILTHCSQQTAVTSSENPPSMSPLALAKVFDLLLLKYPLEYKMLELSEIGYSFLYPFLKREILSKWDPLVHPARFLDIYKEWQRLFEQGKELEGTAVLRGGRNPSVSCPGGTIFFRFVRDLVYEKFRSFIVNDWVVKSPSNPCHLFEIWFDIFPRALTASILQQYVLPKLERTVEGWNPRQEAIPIDVWLHPWIPFLGDSLQSLYPTIRHKISEVLSIWHPSDLTAHTILLPWKNVFDRQSLDVLLVRSVIPKLAMCLRDFIINPVNQDLQPLKWVMLWEDLLPSNVFAMLFVNEFFPKWHQVLCAWLSNQPNYDEVSRWYSGWKKQFSADLKSKDVIRAQFNHALQLMEQSLSGSQTIHYAPPPTTPAPPPGPPPPPSPPSDEEPEPPPPPPKTSLAFEKYNLKMSFKQVVEKFAEDHDTVFMPVPRRLHEGKQVYSFGNCLVLIDQQMLLRQSEGKWVPVSLNELLNYK